VERFSTTVGVGEDKGTNNLLCTAEVVAALYHLHGDVDESNEILTRLDAFQAEKNGHLGPSLAVKREGGKHGDDHDK
jgi:hypothetical protein